MTCSNCATENKQGRRFCVECGAPLAAACPVCAATVEPGEKFALLTNGFFGDRPESHLFAGVGNHTCESPGQCPRCVETSAEYRVEINDENASATGGECLFDAGGDPADQDFIEGIV